MTHLSLPQVAGLLAVTPRTVQRLAKAGILPDFSPATVRLVLLERAKIALLGELTAQLKAEGRLRRRFRRDKRQ